VAKLAFVKSEIVRRLTSFGVEPAEARRESEIIIQHFTNLSPAMQICAGDDTLDGELLAKIESILSRRKKREPLQYCLGNAWFMGMEFLVEKGVFIPRADTETLVLAACALIEQSAALRKNRFTVGEIGLGSGAIAISILKRQPQVQVVGCDISPLALEVTRLNALRLGVSDRLQLVLGNWLDVLPDKLDAVISNPPYIPLSQKDTLAPEVAEFEPALALFGQGTQGVSFYEGMALSLKERMVGNESFVAVEIGCGQGELVPGIFAGQGWRDIKLICDLNRLPRVVTALSPFGV
jgi:release factor glutamine methyltransferase